MKTGFQDIQRNISRGTQETQNYLLEGSSIVVQAFPPDECSRHPSVTVYQLVVLWEVAFGLSEFYLKTLSMCLSILWWVICKNTTLHWMFSRFWPKTTWHPLPIPHPFYLLDLAPGDIFVCLFLRMKKSPQREMFCWCGRGKTKNGRSTKGIKINEFKNCFEQWKKRLNKRITSNGE